MSFQPSLRFWVHSYNELPFSWPKKNLCVNLSSLGKTCEVQTNGEKCNWPQDTSWRRILKQWEDAYATLVRFCACQLETACTLQLWQVSFWCWLCGGDNPLTPGYWIKTLISSKSFTKQDKCLRATLCERREHFERAGHFVLKGNAGACLCLFKEAGRDSRSWAGSSVYISSSLCLSLIFFDWLSCPHLHGHVSGCGRIWPLRLS